MPVHCLARTGSELPSVSGSKTAPLVAEQKSRGALLLVVRNGHQISDDAGYRSAADGRRSVVPSARSEAAAAAAGMLLSR